MGQASLVHTGRAPAFIKNPFSPASHPSFQWWPFLPGSSHIYEALENINPSPPLPTPFLIPTGGPLSLQVLGATRERAIEHTGCYFSFLSSCQEGRTRVRTLSNKLPLLVAGLNQVRITRRRCLQYIIPTRPSPVGATYLLKPKSVL